MAKYVIVGGVAAGMSAAARMRRLDEFSEIIVFERGDYVSYANCGLPYYIGDEIKERHRLFIQTPESFKRLFNVDVRIQSEVIAVQPLQKTVTIREMKSGRQYSESYDELLLSPGGSPIRPPIEGITHAAVHTLWSVSDSDRIRSAIDGGRVKSALVVGAGFIGLEMAENLHARGVNVTVVEMANQVMNALDFEMASLIHREMRMKRITFHLEDGVTAFEDGGNGTVIARLKSGKSLNADLVLLSIGVKPNTAFLKDSGIELGPRGHIVVDAFLKTSDDHIYAAGDAIEVVNPLTQEKTAVPLAGPANKQGRIVADNLCGVKRRMFNGTFGTAVAKVFDLSVGLAGVTEKFCRAEGIPCDSIIIHSSNHAGYYPGATMLCLKLVFSPESRMVLGAQAIGYDGVDKRIDVIATAIKAKMTVDDLAEIEHAYAPPYSSAKDPVNIAGFAAQNILDGLTKPLTWNEVSELDRSAYVLIDVRSPSEYESGTIAGAINIPIEELRLRMPEIPRGKRIILFCHVGSRGYVAERILKANGISDCHNLSGGMETYQMAVVRQDAEERPGVPRTACQADSADSERKGMVSVAIEIDACGLLCPGPITKLKECIDKIGPGECLSITASDPGFYHDAYSWAEVTGNAIRKIDIEKGVVKAVIEKGKNSPAPAASSGNDKTLVLFSDDLDRAIASFVIANGAAAMGRKVTMFFPFWGINILRKRERVSGLKKSIIEIGFGIMMPRGSGKLRMSKMNMGGVGGRLIRGIMKKKNVPSLEEMIQEAIKSGVTLVACQLSMDMMGIRKEELIDGVKIGGVASFLAASEHADTSLFV